MARSRQYLIETITDPEYTDNLVLLSNTHAQGEPLLHIPKQVAESIGLYMNSNKT